MVNPPFEIPRGTAALCCKGSSHTQPGRVDNHNLRNLGRQGNGGEESGWVTIEEEAMLAGAARPPALSITATDDDTQGNPMLESLVAS